MGFDIECIIDINSYPGEYFCPVCRTLVYPNEALQAHCTHLYCKPCLSHIANGSKACPYDGYLVTESESKPLVDSDKTLAENIGKVKVHCLFFRSGCTWEGTLSDCISHCSGCSLGNSPVICNRCGIQIVHRQVHDHAHSCPGVYEAQQVAGATGSSTTSSATTAEVNQTASQSGVPLSQAHNPQGVAANLMPTQNSTQQVNTNSQTVVFAPGAVPTPEQWYQQQYQQHYQQYVGYEPYQQPNQQYYPLQQQPFQQGQQHPVHGQGQPQSHVHTQAPLQVQVQTQQQPQMQPHLVPQTPQQHLQPQAQAQGQAQPAQGQDQPHPQVQLLSQAQPLVPIPPQGQTYVHAPFQASTPNYQVNPQQQPHPPMRPQTHIPPQSLPPPPHGQPTPYSLSTGTRPPLQHPQVPQYQQPHVQVHHPQATQTHAQPQMHPYSQPQNQPPPPTHTQNSSQSYIQPQAQQYHTQSQPHLRPSQPNQSNVPASLPQAPHQPVPPVSGHHSYQPPHLSQQMHSGLPQQHSVHPQPSSGSLPPIQVQGQVPQQPLAMRPPHSLGSLPQQQSSTPLPPQNQVSGIQPAQYQQFPPHIQQPGHPLQHRPVVPAQQTVPQQYAQQQPFIAPFQVQPHQQVHFPQQPSQPPRPYGPPHPQQSQNYAGRPMMPSPGMHVHNNQQSSGHTGPVPLSGPAHLGSREASTNKNNSESTMLENTSGKEVEKGTEVEPVRIEAVTEQHETVPKNEENGAKDGLVKPFIKQEDGGVDDSLERASGGKFLKGDEVCKEESDLLTNSDGLKQVDIQETKMNSQSTPQGPPLGALADPRGFIGRAPQPRHELQFGPQDVVRSTETAMFNDQRLIEGGLHRQTYGNEPSFFRTNGASGSVDKAPHGPNYDVGSKLDPGALGSQSRFLPQHHPYVGHARMDNFGPGPEFGQHHMKHFAPGSPDREYHGISPRGFGGPTFDDKNSGEARRFGEGYRSFNLSSDRGNHFRDGNFPSLSGHLQRGEIDGPGMRFGEHTAPRPLHNHIRNDDFYGQDGQGHLVGGEFSSPGYLSGRFNTGETHGSRAFLGHARVTELGGPGNFSGMRNGYSVQGFPNAANFAGDVDTFDLSRKRRPMNTGWCLICKVDCETIEGLEMHSQTREHQNMAMDMVRTIKQQNKKKHRASGGNIAHDGGRARRVGPAYRGSKS
ncbi:hypothetical protein ACJIZ3_007502 [Penstemon smallii]|uniref:RING-type domain-containing protein n=1 Tax=Penstemon smallii TaxID=265156 RepID=A0ABD3SAR1_9LAMI